MSLMVLPQKCERGLYDEETAIIAESEEVAENQAIYLTTR